MVNDRLLTWGMLEPFLNPTNAWGQRYNVIPSAWEACQASVGQQLGVAPHAVCRQVRVPCQVATRQPLTLSPKWDLETMLAGLIVRPAFWPKISL